MLPRLAIGVFAATWMASLRSRASISMNPPSCSFVSANGPSVEKTLPFRTRMVVAVSTGCSAWAAMRWPAFRSVWS